VLPLSPFYTGCKTNQASFEWQRLNLQESSNSISNTMVMKRFVQLWTKARAEEWAGRRDGRLVQLYEMVVEKPKAIEVTIEETK